MSVNQLHDADFARHADDVDGVPARAAHRADACVRDIVVAPGLEGNRTLLLVGDHRAENITYPQPVRLAEAVHGTAAVIEDGTEARSIVGPRTATPPLAFWAELAQVT